MHPWTYLQRSTIGRIALAAMVAWSAPAAAEAVDRFQPAPPEPGTDIPAATIKFGMRPYADNTFYMIGMKKGWFQDVGITFDPAPYGLKANDSNVTTLLLNSQLDIISEFCPLMLPTYKDANKLKCIAFTDNFLANAILANPALKLKTFKDYLAEGKSYEDALKAALAPMKGKTLVGAPELSDRPFEEYLNTTADAGFKLQVLDDAKSLVLAKAGREDFVNPEGAYRLHAPAGGVDEPRRHRRPHQERTGRGRLADRAADRHRRNRRKFRLPEQPPKLGSALPVGRLARHRRHKKGSIAL
jgi:hypothetical protein